MRITKVEIDVFVWEQWWAWRKRRQSEKAHFLEHNTTFKYSKKASPATKPLDSGRKPD